MPERKLLLVHGVNHDPSHSWMEDIAPIFDPHFEVIRVEYPQYSCNIRGVPRLAGALMLFLDPYAVVTSVLLGLGWWLAFGSVPIVLAIPMLLILILGASRRRRAALDTVTKKIDANLALVRRPNIIAHSYGTHLVVSALRKQPAFEYGELVLLGSVVSESFDWSGLLSARPRACKSVRNEIGKKDCTVRLAYNFRRPLGLGRAGLVGFKGDGRVVHDIGDPNESCRSCCSQEEPAPIHNVFIEEFDHLDFFVGKAHAALFWLPSMWGYDPVVYRSWLLKCEARSLAELHGDAWPWSGDMALGDYLSDLLRKRGSSGDDEETEIALGTVVESVRAALDELEVSNPSHAVLAQLNPSNAIAKAADAVAADAESAGS